MVNVNLTIYLYLLRSDFPDAHSHTLISNWRITTSNLPGMIKCSNTNRIQAPSTCRRYTRRRHTRRSARHTRHRRDRALDTKGTRQLARQESRLQGSLGMAGHNSSRFVEFLVRRTIIPTEIPAEVIYDPALRVDGVLSG